MVCRSFRWKTAAAAVFAVVLMVAPATAIAVEQPLIAIDIGHSLARPGAISVSGRPEFEYNRALALVIEQVLRQHGFRTRLIGEQGDMDVLTDRTAVAAAAGATFFLSVHHDSVQPQYLETWQVDGRERQYTERFSGFSLFVSRRNPAPEESLVCAQAIGEAMGNRRYVPSLHHAEPIKGENRPLADAANGVYYFDDLVVLKTATVPAVLMEAGIILNRRDEPLLREARARKQLADAVAEGLQRCLDRSASPAKTKKGTGK